MKKFVHLALALTLLPSVCLSVEIDDYALRQLKGYTIIYTGNITGYADADNRDKADSWEFEGCDFDRKIFIDDRYQVVCKGYGYSYSYHPEVVIFSNGGDKKMLVEGELYDVQ